MATPVTAQVFASGALIPLSHSRFRRSQVTHCLCFTFYCWTWLWKQMMSKGGEFRISRSIGCAVHKARGSYVPPEVARQWLQSSQTVCFVVSASFFPLLQNDRILEEFTTKILCAFICPSNSLGKCCYSQGLLQACNFFSFNFLTTFFLLNFVIFHWH